MQIFISYASEDSLVANAIETAFNSLFDDGSANLEIHRDVHTFQQGRPLKAQILEQLRKSTVLFVIYSKTLKRSHSYTGFEIGAFSAIIDTEDHAGAKSERRIVSLFLDDPPVTEQDVLGIKLNLDALRPSNGRPDQSLGLSGDFARFLGDVADNVVDKQSRRNDDETIERYTSRIKKLKDTKKLLIKRRIIPKLDSELRVALASLVAKFSIEQKFIQLRWNSASKVLQTGLIDDVLINPGNADVLKSFVATEIGEQITWGKLKEDMAFDGSDGSIYFINAIEYAVNSALSSAPIDNDQVILANDRTLYRVIVTRHYAYFDGGRTMHVYFIPMLSDTVSGPATSALALLRLATRFRMMFLIDNAPLSPEAFELNQGNYASFKTKVLQFARETLFTAGQSHTHKLDDPQNFVIFFEKADRPANSTIARLYENWKLETEKILRFAESVENCIDIATYMKDWDTNLRRYIAFVEPINRQIGIQATERLHGWYKESGVDRVPL